MTRSSPDTQPLPIPFAVSYAHPIRFILVCSHPTTSNEFVVSDIQGSIFVANWRIDEVRDSIEG
jgi:hypothetical protein